MELFWKKGYAATSVQDLVQALGINRASLYTTFGDKEQLFQKAFDLYRATNIAGLKRFFSHEPNVKQGFQKLFAMALANGASDADRKGCFVVNTTTELMPHDTTMRGILKKNQELFTGLFKDYLEMGEEKGQFARGKDLQALASLLFLIYNGIKVVTMTDPDTQQLLRSVKEVLSLLDE